MFRVVLAVSRVELQEAVSHALASDDEFELLGVAGTADQAIRMTCDFGPDIVIMGLAFLEVNGMSAASEIMIERPTPIVIVARLSDTGTETHLRALDLGALAVIAAPDLGKPDSTAKFLSTLKAMSQVKVVRRFRSRRNARREQSPEAVTRKAKIVAMAASTGGPAAIKAVLERLPADFPAPVLAVQHISSGFVDGVAEWLDSAVPMKVKLAANGERMKPGTAYLAPDGHHLGVLSKSRILLSDAEPIKGFRPSGTFLFDSVARTFGGEALAVILTGMGDDGLEGARAVHEAGGTVIAQDEESSIVFGMPKATIEAGIAEWVLPLPEIAARIALAAAPDGKSPR
jgi:two-component system chemotaxis response regulator CheB